MALQVYLNFNGNCREAVEFYSEVFNTEKQKILTFGDTPGDPNHPLPEEAKKLIMHTFLIIGGNMVMFSDVPPGMPLTIGDNISLIVLDRDVDKLKSIFDKLKEGGKIKMELQETFWSKCYGYLTDRFGVNWQISHDKES